MIDVKDEQLVLGWLQRTAVELEFEKSDGTLRKMKATLNPALITTTYEKKTERTKESTYPVQPVFDVEAQGWRSFRWDRLLRVGV